MPSILQQPFPSFRPGIRGIFMCIVAGASVFLVLFVLGAFGMNNMALPRRFYFSVAYALVTVLVSVSFTVILPLLLPSLFKEEKWTVAREIIFFVGLIVVIAAANLLTSHWWLERAPVTWENFLSAIGITSSVAILPVTISIMVKQQMLLRRFSREAKQIDESIFSAPAPAPVLEKNGGPGTDEKKDSSSSSIIELTGENAQDKLNIPLDQLLYMNAADNYVKIYYASEKGVQHSILRSSLRKMEESMAAYPRFYRCHRAYLVNLLKVAHISGNAQGYKLHFHQTEAQVPVSRSLNLIIAGKLARAKDDQDNL